MTTTKTKPTIAELSDLIVNSPFPTTTMKPYTDWRGGNHVTLEFTWQAAHLESMARYLDQYGIVTGFSVGFTLDVAVAA